MIRRCPLNSTEGHHWHNIVTAIIQLLVTGRLAGHYQLVSTPLYTQNYMKCYAQPAALSYCSQTITLSCAVCINQVSFAVLRSTDTTSTPSEFYKPPSYIATCI